MTKVRTTARRLAVAGAAIAALTLAGCGTESAEPSEKQWDGDSQSQSEKSDKKDKGDGQQGSGNDDSTGKPKDEDTVVKGGDANKPDADTKAAVEDFMADYLAAANEAIKDGDFSKVEQMVDTCTICEDNWSYVKGAYEKGGKVEGALFTKNDIAAGQEHDGKVIVSVVSTISAYKTFDGSGTVVDKGGAEELTYQFGVAKKDGEWKIVSGRLVE